MAGRVLILFAAGLSPAAALPPCAAASALLLAAALLAPTGVRTADKPAAPEVAPVTVTGHRAGCPPKASGPDLACLSAALTASALDAHAQAVGAPSAVQALGDGAPGRVGAFDYAGVKEQLGSNFGKSAFPQRPAPPVYSTPPLSPPPRPR